MEHTTIGGNMFSTTRGLEVYVIVFFLEGLGDFTSTNQRKILNPAIEAIHLLYKWNSTSKQET